MCCPRPTCCLVQGSPVCCLGLCEINSSGNFICREGAESDALAAPGSRTA
jgi:hypothetical protein